MQKFHFFFLFIFLILVNPLLAQQSFEKDVIKTSKGDLEITFIGHGSLMFHFDEKVIHVDPVGRYADYSKMPKADIILVTHEHGDHYDTEVIKILSFKKTEVLFTESCLKRYKKGIVIKNGEKKSIKGVQILAIPAYNIVHERSKGVPFHPKGRGNGYVITFSNKRVYIAGDTENIPEMADLENIDFAFLPMNLPYTMTPLMVSEAAKKINPKVLYPYHYGNSDISELLKLMEKQKEIEVRIRKMK